MFKPDVICIGSATIDHFLISDKPLQKIKLGDKVLITDQEKHSGGGATNVAAALAKLGLKAKILSKLGNDHDAEFILKELKQYKIKNICLHRSKKNTDVGTIISSTTEKDRIIYVHKGASEDLNENDYKKSQLNARWIFIGSLLGKSLQTGKNIVKHTKAKILFNPSSYLAKKGKNYLKTILKKTTILILNKEEAQSLLNTKNNSSKEMLLNLNKLGPKIVIITDGAKKLSAYNNHQIYSLIPPKVKVIQTAGAGDAFNAGLLAGMIKNYSFADALRLGQVQSTSVIQHIGTKNKLLNEKEAKIMMNKFKIKVEVKNVSRY